MKKLKSETIAEKIVEILQKRNVTTTENVFKTTNEGQMRCYNYGMLCHCSAKCEYREKGLKCFKC